MPLFSFSCLLIIRFGSSPDLITATGVGDEMNVRNIREPLGSIVAFLLTENNYIFHPVVSKAEMNSTNQIFLTWNNIGRQNIDIGELCKMFNAIRMSYYQNMSTWQLVWWDWLRFRNNHGYSVTNLFMHYYYYLINQDWTFCDGQLSSLFSFLYEASQKNSRFSCYLWTSISCNLWQLVLIRDVRVQSNHLGLSVNKIAPLYDTSTTLERSRPWNLGLGRLRDSQRQIREEKLNLVCVAVAFISEANRHD